MKKVAFKEFLEGDMATTMRQDLLDAVGLSFSCLRNGREIAFFLHYKHLPLCNLPLEMIFFF